MGHIWSMSTIAEIQEAIEKLPPQEKSVLSTWLSSQKDYGSFFGENEMKEMAADPQVREELRCINRDFAEAESDGLDKI